MTMTVLAARASGSARRAARRSGCPRDEDVRRLELLGRHVEPEARAGKRRSMAASSALASVGTAGMPFSRSASVIPSTEPIASPSGRTCAHTTTDDARLQRDDGVVVRGEHGA